jgi:hypothetical protein
VTMFYSDCITIIIEVLLKKRCGHDFATVRGYDSRFESESSYDNEIKYLMDE